MWLERLRNLPLWVALWLEHQRRDAFWEHASVRDDWSAIECPVVCDQRLARFLRKSDAAIARELESADEVFDGTVGTPLSARWAARTANGYMQESLRWWDKWLKDKETGIMDEALFRAYMMDSVRPEVLACRASGPVGRRVGLPCFRGWRRLMYLTKAGLLDEPGEEDPVNMCSPESTGALCGMWTNHGLTSDHPPDQREDDGKSMVFRYRAFEGTYRDSRLAGTRDRRCFGQAERQTDRAAL